MKPFENLANICHNIFKVNYKKYDVRAKLTMTSSVSLKKIYNLAHY